MPGRVRPRAGGDGERRLARAAGARAGGAFVDDMRARQARRRLHRLSSARGEEEPGDLIGLRAVRVVAFRTRPDQSRPRAELLHARLLSEERARLRRAAQGADAEAERHHRAGEGVGAARPRRRRLPDRAEVAVRPQGHAEAEIHRLQRRRERAGHVQGPRADGAQPAPAHRGVRDRLLRHRRQGRLHLHPRRVLPRAGDPRARDREGLSRRLPRARTSSAAASTATSTCIAAPAPTKPARRPR